MKTATAVGAPELCPYCKKRPVVVIASAKHEAIEQCQVCKAEDDLTLAKLEKQSADAQYVAALEALERARKKE